MKHYEPSHQELRERVNARLSEILNERKERLPEAAPLLGAIEDMVTAGGKRLRPAFCYWGYRCAGGTGGEEILNVAASLELLHTFAIVHDDIMDKALERRGQPTVNAAHGIDAALLAGDLALVTADDVFMQAGFTPAVIVRGFGCYSRMRQEVIAGQFLDLQASQRGDVREAEARRIAVLKSGRYSVEEPLQIGAVLAGAGGDLLRGLSDFAAPLGEAFQLRDDLLGTFGTSAATGKSIDSDIREGKRNILYAKTLAALGGEERQFFASRWGAGADLSAGEVDRLRELVKTSGAVRATEALLEELRERVTAALRALSVEDDARGALEDLSRLSIERAA